MGNNGDGNGMGPGNGNGGGNPGNGNENGNGMGAGPGKGFDPGALLSMLDSLAGKPSLYPSAVSSLFTQLDSLVTQDPARSSVYKSESNMLNSVLSVYTSVYGLTGGTPTSTGRFTSAIASLTRATSTSSSRGSNSSTSSASASDGSSDGSSSPAPNTGAIVGGVVGGIAALAILGTLAAVLVRRHHRIAAAKGDGLDEKWNNGYDAYSGGDGASAAYTNGASSAYANGAADGAGGHGARSEMGSASGYPASAAPPASTQYAESASYAPHSAAGAYAPGHLQQSSSGINQFGVPIAAGAMVGAGATMAASHNEYQNHYHQQQDLSVPYANVASPTHLAAYANDAGTHAGYSGSSYGPPLQTQRLPVAPPSGDVDDGFYGLLAPGSSPTATTNSANRYSNSIGNPHSPVSPPAVGRPESSSNYGAYGGDSGVRMNAAVGSDVSASDPEVLRIASVIQQNPDIREMLRRAPSAPPPEYDQGALADAMQRNSYVGDTKSPGPSAQELQMMAGGGKSSRLQVRNPSAAQEIENGFVAPAGTSAYTGRAPPLPAKSRPQGS